MSKDVSDNPIPEQNPQGPEVQQPSGGGNPSKEEQAPSEALSADFMRPQEDAQADRSLERVRPPLPIIKRLKLGRLALYTSIVEVPAAITTAVIHESGFLTAGSFLSAAMIGGAIFGAHEHHVNGYPHERQLMSSAIKERTHPTIHG